MTNKSTISDLLGLNAPRGLLGNTFNNANSGIITPPPASLVNYQVRKVKKS